MITIGFYKGHNATACILKDGEILSAVSEERFSRVKNTDTFPLKSIAYCLESTGIKIQDVDYFCRIYKHPEGYINPSGDVKTSPLIIFIRHFAQKIKSVFYNFPSLGRFTRKIYTILSNYILTPYFENQFKRNLSNFLQIEQKKILLIDHHTCHAYAAFYGFVPKEKQKEDYLVITIDGEGDGICSSISTVKNGHWKKISTTLGGNSIATFYGLITEYLGMKMNEHEYKVMGLAPYASEYEIQKVLPLFEGLFSIDDNLVIHSKIPSGSYLHYFDDTLRHHRFDGIAGAAQRYVEEFVSSIITRAIDKTKIYNVVVSGGFFMNVKANKIISQLKEVKNLYICPSAGDESAVFGAAFIGYQKLCADNKTYPLKAIENLYLGPLFTDSYIDQLLQTKKLKGCRVNHVKDIEPAVAKLLSQGKIVARFKGRMEWGARALGNRSILMDPRRKDLLHELNAQIKSRDFWMPFAATVLEEDMKKYLINPKSIDGQYMIMAYDTTDKGKKDLSAAVHPYDFTCRPQILKKRVNTGYSNLIQHFKKLTGIGAVLNTSFNFHGEPIVCSPEDALNTFNVTGLKYLALGNYLISKVK